MRKVLLALLLSSAAASPRAAGETPVEGDFAIRDFRFSSGQSLPEVKIHYRTLGAPRRDAQGRVSNAVLILHGTTGTGKQFLTDDFAGVLFGPGQLLDASRYYLILPDGIGHGGSSKPSDGLRAGFPRYGYDDMVRAQHRLLTEGLRVDHLRLLLGTSMGGMHAWVWAETYPDFADGIVPLACLPAPITGRNRAWRRLISEWIRNDPEWKGGGYASQPRSLTEAVGVMTLFVGGPIQWQKEGPTREQADAYLARQVDARLSGKDANDFLYAVEASGDYDPSPGLERIDAPVLAINFADDAINPPETGIAEKAIAKVRSGRFVLIPASAETRGHGTHSLPRVWQQYLRGFLSRFSD
ncbi:MAG TPA: alpha/beta fold hydrolase [Thermoanaerobaculia bacterium]